MKMEQTACSETSAYKIQTPGNYPEENIQQSVGFFIIKRNVLTVNFKWSLKTEDFIYTARCCSDGKNVDIVL